MLLCLYSTISVSSQSIDLSPVKQVKLLHVCAAFRFCLQ